MRVTISGMVTWNRIQSLYQPRAERHARAAQLMGLLCPPPVFTALFHERHEDAGVNRLMRGVDVSQVQWALEERAGPDLREILIDRTFQRAVDEAYRAVFRQRIECSADVDALIERGTWNEPPILISGEVLGSAVRDTLLVGSTRLGALLGLLNRGVVAEATRHLVWVGVAK